MTMEDLNFLSSLSNAKLRAECQSLIEDYPPAKPVLMRLIQHLSSSTEASAAGPVAVGKKRKLTGDIKADSSKLVATIVDLPFTTPRKKLNLLCYLGSHFDLSGEMYLAFPEIYAAILVPTPNKQQRRHYSLIVLSASATGNSFIASFPDTPLLLTSNSASAAVSESGLAVAATTNSEYFKQLFNNVLSIPLLTPQTTDFVSNFPPTHGMGKQAKSAQQLYANCYFKAKEGSLFFLPIGIFFGLRRPFFLMKTGRIVAASIEGLTTRSFNLKVTYRPSQSTSADSSDFADGGGSSDADILALFKKVKDDGSVDIEFDMIDNCEFDGIMQYLQKYKLDQVRVGGLEVDNSSPGGGNETIGAISDGQSGYFQGGGGIDDDYDEEEDEDFHVETSSDDDSDSDSSSDESDSNSGGQSETDAKCEDGDDDYGDGEEEELEFDE